MAILIVKNNKIIFCVDITVQQVVQVIMKKRRLVACIFLYISNQYKFT